MPREERSTGHELFNATCGTKTVRCKALGMHSVCHNSELQAHFPYKSEANNIVLFHFEIRTNGGRFSTNFTKGGIWARGLNELSFNKKWIISACSANVIEFSVTTKEQTGFLS